MSTTAQRIAPGLEKRMLLTIIASLLLGGVAGGLVSWVIQSGLEKEVAPAITSRQAADTARTVSPEYNRALNFAPSKSASTFSPERLRVLQGPAYAAPTASKNFSPERLWVLRGVKYVAPTASKNFSPERLRALRGAKYVAPTAKQNFSPEKIRVERGPKATNP